MTAECKCGKPTKDAAYFCGTCGDALTQALAEVPWVDEEIEVTITGQRGVDYRRGGGASHAPAPDPKPGDRPDLGAHIQGEGVNWGAVDARTNLRTVLAAWSRKFPPHGVKRDVPAMSRHLMLHVDRLSLSTLGPEALDQIVKAVDRCIRAIDNAPEKWFAGPCNAELLDVECGADLYALSAKGDVRCRVCAAVYDVAERRKWLLEAAEDRLADATELARSVTWLGSSHLTRDRIYTWAKRGRIVAKATTRCDTHLHDVTPPVCRNCQPLYRIGDAIDLLAKEAA